jgi:predicted AlkP superfamily phosphohydrolase/phosphomutase
MYIKPSPSRRRLAVTLLVAAILAPAARAAELPKTIVIGFDGADARLTRQWMDEGKLPNLSKLAAEGTFSPLQPTIPSQTPVSWSTFATGLDPGRHGIIDFLKRDPENYRPKLALVDEGQKKVLLGHQNPWLLGVVAGLIFFLLLWLMLRRRPARWLALGVPLFFAAAAFGGVFEATRRWVPEKLPTVTNPQQGETFWKLLGDAGQRVRVLRLPQTFPAEDFHDGKLLTGLGTPDLSLRVGKPFFFTSQLFYKGEGGDFSSEVVELEDNRGRIETTIKGPPDKIFGKEGEKLKFASLPMVIESSADRKKLTIEVSGNKLELQPGQWSDWQRFQFSFNPLVSLHGIGRFHLISLEPEIRLYLTPIQFDPENLPSGFALSTPRDFARELIGKDGLYKTIGWAIDTWSIEEGHIDEALFLEDVEMTVARDEKMLEEQLAKSGEWDVLVHYFEFTDKVSHIMYRLFDPSHPRYEAALAEKYGNAILESYQRMDKIVGLAMQQAPAGTRLFVLSDHGFSSWRWSMNYNTWLAKNGYMTLIGEDPERHNLEDLFEQGDFFVNVDWSRTKAYALGFGSIFINLEGREGKGSVKSADYEAVRAELREKLLAYTHGETGEKPVAHIFYREEAWDSFDPRVAPDLIATNSLGFRAGWQDTLGGIAGAVVEPNEKKWSGDHCSLYPPLVPGILFSNLKISTEKPYMGDMVPTLLDLQGVPSQIRFNGRSLLLK